LLLRKSVNIEWPSAFGVLRLPVPDPSFPMYSTLSQ
jgi:hypothetical protein